MGLLEKRNYPDCARVRSLGRKSVASHSIELLAIAVEASGASNSK